jgi:subfamily B ATP-binding cassette protein MsbA
VPVTLVLLFTHPGAFRVPGAIGIGQGDQRRFWNCKAMFDLLSARLSLFSDQSSSMIANTVVYGSVQWLVSTDQYGG